MRYRVFHVNRRDAGFRRGATVDYRTVVVSNCRRFTTASGCKWHNLHHGDDWPGKCPSREVQPMGPLFTFGKRTTMCVCLLQLCIYAAFAQSPSSLARCQVTTSPLPVRAEGLTERMGDIVLRCSGAVPGSVFSGNLILALPVTVTNRVDANNLTSDAVITVDLGDRKSTRLNF